MTRTWQGISDGEPWKFDVEVDRFTEAEGYVVSVVADHEDDDGKHQTLIALSSAQAREVAATLIALASAVDANNLRVAGKSDHWATPGEPGRGVDP